MLLTFGALLGLCSTASAQATDGLRFYAPSSKVICLYDSMDEGTHGYQDVLVGRVVPSLQRLGLQAILHDVHSGLPDDATMREVRGIVTAFDDAAMVGAKKYIKWLNGWVSAGKKLVIFNNFGAYQEADTKQWLPPAAVNGVFRVLGVSYLGDWTNDGSDLQLSGRTKLLDSKFDVTKAAHYYHFSRVSKDVVGHAVVTRRSKPDQSSYVVFTSASGGMAMSRYYETVDGKEQIDRTAFLRAALFTPTHAGSARVLFVTDPNSPTGHSMLQQLQWVVKYGWLAADFVTIADAAHLRKEDLNRYSAVVMASEGADRLNNSIARMIERWVYKDGGGFVSLFPSYRAEWDRMLGIKRRSEKTTSRTGVKYGKGFFPGVEGLLVQDKGDKANPGPLVVTQIPSASLADDVTVFAHGVDVGSPSDLREPVMWQRRHGKGRVVARNDYNLSQKRMRGHVLQMIMHAQKVGVAPQINSAVYFVDDSPQPMWGAKYKPYEGATAEKKGGIEYQTTDTAFYRGRWWDDLMALATKWKVKMTFVLIFSYDDNTDKDFSAAPFYGSGAEGVPLEQARMAVAKGHEVGLHGFNHQSLILDKDSYTSKGWTSREAMVESLKVARVEWERVFGEGQTPFTYIAPNNHIGRAGKEAVREAFPEIRVMAAQYVRDRVIPGQEFGVDPDAPHFMAMPRVSSEFYIGAHNNLVMHDAMMLVGAWTHFVHPDDVFDPDRDGGMTWTKLYKAADDMFAHMNRSFPWLKSRTAREAYHEMVRYTSGPFHVEHSGNEVVVHHAGTKERPASFVVRVDPNAKVYNVTNGRIVHTDGDYAYHFIEGYGGKTTLSIEHAE